VRNGKREEKIEEEEFTTEFRGVLHGGNYKNLYFKNYLIQKLRHITMKLLTTTP